MSRIRILIASGLLLTAACDDDDDDDRIPGIDAPVETTFQVPLTTAAEVPLCPAAGANATGSSTVRIATDNTVSVDSLTFSGMSGPPTAAHIHAGAPGVAGPVVFDLGTDLTSFGRMTFTGDDYPDPVPEGAPANYDSFLRDMRAGNAYINVHTAACPQGELRGQIQ
jgi:hypothetical protein